MKKLFFYLLAGTLFFALSCSKKDPIPDAPTDPIIDQAADTVFSKLSVEENKKVIENSGYQMLDEMNLMEQEPAMQANIAMVTFMGTSDPFEGNSGLNKKIILPNTIAFAPVFASANYNGSNVKGMLKSIQVNPADDPETIQEAYDLLVGVYTWNATAEAWDYVATGSIIKFVFPSTQDATVNNATYTVSYTGYSGPNPIEDYNGDLPQNVTTELKVDGTLVMSFVVDVVYNSNGYPTKIESTLTMGQWVWYAMASNTNNAAFATEFSFKHANKILLRFTLDAAGNWSKENIDANYNEETKYYKSVWNENIGQYQYIEVSENEYYDWSETNTQFDIHKVITNGNAAFQVMNVIMAGSIDVLNFGTVMKQIDETYDWETQEEQAIAAEVVAINENISLNLYKADSNLIVAMIEAYPVSEDYSYETWVYNPVTQQYELVSITQTDHYINFRFVFADGSKVDAETYFGEGFEDVIDEFDAYLDELETSYGK
jgi:hypothetical protein